jgi:hypothetical protein
MERILLLLRSATIKLPRESKVRWWGQLKEAATPSPSAYVAAPLPAKVDTKPPGVITLILALF